MFSKPFDPDVYIEKLMKSGERQKAAYKSDNPIYIESEEIKAQSEIDIKPSFQRMNFEIDLRRHPADYDENSPLPNHPRRFSMRDGPCVDTITSRLRPHYTNQDYQLNVGSLWQRNTSLHTEEIQCYNRERWGGEPLDKTNLFHWLHFSEESKDHIISLLQKLVDENGNENRMRAICCYDIPKSVRIKSREHDVKAHGIFEKQESDIVSIDLFHLHVFNPHEDIPKYYDTENRVSFTEYPLATYMVKEILSDGHKNFTLNEYPNIDFR